MEKRLDNGIWNNILIEKMYENITFIQNTEESVVISTKYVYYMGKKSLLNYNTNSYFCRVIILKLLSKQTFSGSVGIFLFFMTLMHIFYGKKINSYRSLNRNTECTILSSFSYFGHI